MKSAIVAALLALTACGKVGETLPPIIRIPQKVENLSATQTGYTVVLSWTNPSKYIDNNPVTDTGVVHVFRNDIEIGMFAATAAGQPQSFPVDVTNSLDTPLTFTIQVVVPKANKPSPVSSAAKIRPVDVPGSPVNLVPTVDLGKIVLAWDPPERKPELVEGYVVQRSDKPAAPVVRVRRFEDTEYEPGKTYTYTVTAVRGTNPQIAGGSANRAVIAKDEKPPAAPTGLEIQLLGDTAFLQWERNAEPDLKGYKVFRSDRGEEPVSITVANAYADRDYTPGKGISYWVIAEDISGNKSSPSAPKLGP